MTTGKKSVSRPARHPITRKEMKPEEGGWPSASLQTREGQRPVDGDEADVETRILLSFWSRRARDPPGFPCGGVSTAGFKSPSRADNTAMSYLVCEMVEK